MESIMSGTKPAHSYLIKQQRSDVCAVNTRIPLKLPVAINSARGPHSVVLTVETVSLRLRVHLSLQILYGITRLCVNDTEKKSHETEQHLEDSL